MVESESGALNGAASLGKFVVGTFRSTETKLEVLGCDWTLCTVESDLGALIGRVSFDTTGINTLGLSWLRLFRLSSVAAAISTSIEVVLLLGGGREQ